MQKTREEANNYIKNTEPTPVHIFSDLVDAVFQFGTAYGADKIILSQNDIDSLKAGNTLAFTDGEYHHFLTMVDIDKDE